MQPLQSDSPLIVYLDVKSPYAYLAKDPTWQLEADFGIEVDFRPLTLNIPSFLGSARVDTSGKVVENNRTPRQWQGVRYAYMDAKRYARVKDILIYGPQKIWDSSLAGIGMLWARQDRGLLKGYMDRVFERFWKRELDIEDPDCGGEHRRRSRGRPRRVSRLPRRSWPRGARCVAKTPCNPAGLFGVPELRDRRRDLLRARTLAGGSLDSLPAAKAPRPTSPTTGSRHERRYCFRLRLHQRSVAASVQSNLRPSGRVGRRHRTAAVPHRSPRSAAEGERRDGGRTPCPRACGLRRGGHGALRALARCRTEPGCNGRGLDLGLRGLPLGRSRRVPHATTRRACSRSSGRDGSNWIASPWQRVLDDLGAPGFEDYDFARDLEKHKADVASRGVYNVPTYVVDGQHFVGRQHLPMIRWLLGGSEGPGPL